MDKEVGSDERQQQASEDPWDVEIENKGCLYPFFYWSVYLIGYLLGKSRSEIVRMKDPYDPFE